MSAFRELYFSVRSGKKDWKNWAKSKFLTLYGEENEDVFNSALSSFTYSGELSKLRSLELDVDLRREDLKLSGRLDEIVFDGERRALILSSRAPEEGVWYSDRIKLAAFSILTSFKGGYVYYCKSGKLRKVEITQKDKRTVLRCMERVEKLRRGFLPEKKEQGKKCEGCIYRDVCESEGETFASRFL